MSSPFVQSASVQDDAVASVTIAPITTTSGNLLVVMVGRESALAWTGSPVTDSYGNVWTQAWFDANTGNLFSGGALYYAENIVGGAGHTVTLTIPSGTDGLAMAVGEFTNIKTAGAYLASAHTTNQAVSPGGIAVPPILSGNLAGVVAGQLLIGSGTVGHGLQPPASLGLFTDAYAVGNDFVFNEGVLFSYALVDAIAQYHFSYNQGANVSSNEGYGLATFKGTGIAFVQATGVTAGSVASVTSPAITTTNGHFLVVVCALNARSFSGSPITDSYSNTWHLAWASTGPGDHAACYYAENITGGAGHTVTFTPPGGNDYCAFGLGEFSGIDLAGSLDQTISGNGNTRPYDTGNAAITTQAEELLIGGGSHSDGGVLPYSVVPLEWSTVEAIPTLGGVACPGVIFAYQVAPADGTYEYGMTTGVSGATSWEAVGIAAFAIVLTLSCPGDAGRVGDVYSSFLVAAGGTPPYLTFAITAGSLPTGLTLNASTGEISGTPTIAGTFPFTAQVTDTDADTADVICFITVIPSVGPVDLNADTWVFDATESQWHQRAAGVRPDLSRWRPRGCSAVGSTKILVGDYATGDLSLLDMETFTDNGDPIERIRRAPYLSSENQWVFVDRVELGLQSGVGNAAAPDPQVSLCFSRDGGANYDTATDTSMGVLGDDTASAVWRAMGRVRADRLVVEVSTTEPVRIVWGPGLWFKVRQGTGQR